MATESGVSFGFVREWIAHEFGGEIETLDGTVSVGVTPTEVAGGDGDRGALLMLNLSAATIYVAPNTLVAATRGIFLGANGGSLALVLRDDLVLPTLQWWALAAAAASDLYVLRVRRYRVVP